MVLKEAYEGHQENYKILKENGRERVKQEVFDLKKHQEEEHKFQQQTQQMEQQKQ